MGPYNSLSKVGCRVSIYWGVENTPEGTALHSFPSLEERNHWLWETLGLTVESVNGRGLPSDLRKKDNPFIVPNDLPVFRH